MDLIDLMRAGDPEALRDNALARVEANADAEWWELAKGAALNVLNGQERFTSEDVWRELARAQIMEPHEKRALGALMVRLRKEGLIEATPEFRTSGMASRHSAPIRVWRRKEEG